MFLKWEILVHSYMKLKSEQHYIATWIEFDLNLDLIELNSNTFNSNSIILKFN
jgi:hypothetical protein